MVLRNFGRFPSSLGKVVSLGWIVFGYAWSSPCRLMSIGLLLMSIGLLPQSTSILIRYGHVNMSSCLNKCPAGLLVFTSPSAHRLAPDGFVLQCNHVGIDLNYKGGSVHMAAASAATDCGVLVDIMLNTGRWASWQVFNKFYNQACLRAVAPSIGLTSLASLAFQHSHD